MADVGCAAETTSDVIGAEVDTDTAPTDAPPTGTASPTAEGTSCLFCNVIALTVPSLKTIAKARYPPTLPKRIVSR